MTDDTSRWCALLPCSDELSLAVPQNCLAEIVTMHTAREHPPEKIRWRGESVPVIDFSSGQKGWHEERSGTGLLAIFRGLQGDGCEYWAVAVRGDGLRMKDITHEEIEDLPEEVLELATAAFRMGDKIYQVPNLTVLQQKITAGLAAA